MARIALYLVLALPIAEGLRRLAVGATRIAAIVKRYSFLDRADGEA